MSDFKEKLKAYIDLTRIQFFFVWPLLFCSGLFLSFTQYGGFSWTLVGKAALIALLGFEAGFILNDYIDREHDTKDIDEKLTNYWRLFKSRPIPEGTIPAKNALTLFIILVALTSALILTLPYPNSIYVFTIMVYSYTAEYFYQTKKRDQDAPFAQLIGRTDFTLFPVAGYLVNGQPDLIAISYFIFFYPFAQAHLGANDIIDVVNDKARGLNTIPVLYGIKGTVYWIIVFTLLHMGSATIFINALGQTAKYGVIAGLLVLITGNIIIYKGNTTANWLKALPFFHITMLIYTSSIIIDYFL